MKIVFISYYRKYVFSVKIQEPEKRRVTVSARCKLTSIHVVRASHLLSVHTQREIRACVRRLNQRHFFSFFHSLPLTFKTRSVRPRVPGRAVPAPRARTLTGRQVPGTWRPHAGRHATARGGHSGRGAVHCRFHLSFSVFFSLFI